MHTVRSISTQMNQALANAHNENSAFETEYILSEFLDCSRLDIHLNQDRVLSQDQADQIDEITARRCLNEPLQYIFKKAYFMNLCFEVGPGVLIPRPETELLVDYVCKQAAKNATICDIGTGSGTISVSIAYERPDTQVVGVDLHQAALDYACRNRDTYSIKNLELLQSNLFSALNGKQFDVITANLPYISQAEYDKLEDEVKVHEPKSALYADEEGRALIRQTITEAPHYLLPSALIIFEIGYEQGPAIKELLESDGNYCEVDIIQDYNKLDRFVKARLNS